MKKKIITLALLGATTSLMALGGEFAYLYKDPRIMGMGGANVAVGAYSTSVFSNPAGLTDIKKEHGFVVDILSVGLSASAQTLDFAKDLSGIPTDLPEDEQLNRVIKVLDNYNGEHFHYGVDNYTSISKNSDAFAWSIGLLAAADTNMQPHTNSSNGIIASSSRGYGGIILGAAKPFYTDYGQVDIGVGAKFIMQQSYEGVLSAGDIAGSDMEGIVDQLRNKYEKQSNGFGVDLGVTYHPVPNNFWHPALGMSVMNIGSMGMDGYYGGQPMTVNFGASIAPDVSFMNKLVIAADYVDAFNANTIREYTYNGESEDITYKDYTDSDMMKRIRLGVGLGLIDSTFFSTTVNLGMYQSAYTAGLNMELSLFKLNVATYEEEIGSGDTTIPDRRYMAQLGFGW